MIIMQWLGLILFAALLFKVLQVLPAKIKQLRNGEEGARLDLATSMLAVAFCVWALVSVFSFPH